MANITTFKDSEYFHISINSKKDILALKYNNGIRDSFFFNNNGINLQINNKIDRNFKLKLNTLNDGRYTLIIYFIGGGYEIHYFDVSFLDNIEKSIDGSSIIFTDYAPFDKNKLMTSITKFSFIFSPIKDNPNIKHLFNLGSHITQKDIFKYINNVYKITDLINYDKKINIKMKATNIPQEYLYGSVILNSNSNPIILVKNQNETLIDTNTLSLNVCFSII